MIEYYKQQMDLDLTSQEVMTCLRGGDPNISANASMSGAADPLLFLQIDRLLQTESTFQVGSCEVMMQLFIYILALVMANDNIKDSFIEPIMELDEQIQEHLQGIIQEAMQLID